MPERANSDRKRKRSDVDEADPKLKEFMAVMQPNAKPKLLDDDDSGGDAVEQPPRKVQVLELPHEDSDGEYQKILKARKSAQKSSKSEMAPSSMLDGPGIEPNEQPMLVDRKIGQDATDDDWLRGRTNRLLDLMDPEALPSNVQDTEEAFAEKDQEAVVDLVENEVETSTPEPQIDPLLEQIQANGRLFVRNLPYSTSEQDLEGHFKEYGPLEEVGHTIPFFFISRDEYPDRDILCFTANDADWTSILVDASCFLSCVLVILLQSFILMNADNPRSMSLPIRQVTVKGSLWSSTWMLLLLLKHISI